MWNVDSQYSLQRDSCSVQASSRWEKRQAKVLVGAGYYFLLQHHLEKIIPQGSLHLPAIPECYVGESQDQNDEAKGFWSGQLVLEQSLGQTKRVQKFRYVLLTFLFWVCGPKQVFNVDLDPEFLNRSLLHEFGWLQNCIRTLTRKFIWVALLLRKFTHGTNFRFSLQRRRSRKERGELLLLLEDGGSTRGRVLISLPPTSYQRQCPAKRTDHHHWTFSPRPYYNLL